MFERGELPLKILCGVVGAFVLYRLALIIVHINPLYHLTIPALPSLSSAAVTAAATNGSKSAQPQASHGTNDGHQPVASKGTNLLARSTNYVEKSTNTLARSSTNGFAQGTNVVAQAAIATNSTARSTNSAVVLNGKPGPNSLPPPAFGRGGMPPGGFPGMPKPGPELPPEVQARIDRVIDSEIIAPVMRPLPMALLGIAGTDVFLRAPNGQTGLIKEGEELGGVKLVRIGVNRVLVEQQGERKELTIFAGLGGESLLSSQKDSPK
jgi:hypothetical protein